MKKLNLLSAIIATASSIDMRSREIKAQYQGRRTSTSLETQKQIFEAAETKRAMRRARNLNNAKMAQDLEEL